MKSLSAILIALTILSTHSYAQSAVQYGLRGGVTVANLQGDAVNNLNKLFDLSKGFIQTSSRTGFYAGGYVNLPLGDIISIEPGLYYAQKGYIMKGDLSIKSIDFLSANAKAELQSSYIDAPFIIRANLAKGLQVFAGPQVSYLVRNNLQLNAGALGLSLFKKNMDVTDNFKKWDAGLTGGIAYQFNTGFNLQASYYYGLSKVDANSNFKSYNNVIKVGIGFTF